MRKLIAAVLCLAATSAFSQGYYKGADGNYYSGTRPRGDQYAPERPDFYERNRESGRMVTSPFVPPPSTLPPPPQVVVVPVVRERVYVVPREPRIRSLPPTEKKERYTRICSTKKDGIEVCDESKQ